ncbi:hypothetical protein PV325_009527 [Microctonus aethiopoides]|nr:hypothetical protein PV325_009527 [Microctonus aethiopoides]KAK0097965.1 hypothetical protein PV326_012196 [Microctonus aethiopoides]
MGRWASLEVVSREIGQGLIAGRKHLGLVGVVKPSLRGVTGSATCKSQGGRERVPVAALGEPMPCRRGNGLRKPSVGAVAQDYTRAAHVFMDRKCLRLQPIKISFPGFDSVNRRASISLGVLRGFTTQ